MTSFNNQRSLRTDDIAGFFVIVNFIEIYMIYILGAKPKTYGSLIRKDYATIENK